MPKKLPARSNEIAAFLDQFDDSRMFTAPQLNLAREALRGYCNQPSHSNRSRLGWTKTAEKIAALTDLALHKHEIALGDNHDDVQRKNDENTAFRKRQILKISRFVEGESDGKQPTTPNWDILRPILEFLLQEDIGLLSVESLVAPEISIGGAIVLAKYFWELVPFRRGFCGFQAGTYKGTALWEGKPTFRSVTFTEHSETTFSVMEVEALQSNSKEILIAHGWAVLRPENELLIF